MKAKILMNFNDKIIMVDGSTPLIEFQDYIDSLDFVEQKRMKKMIKNFTYQYLDLFPKNERKQILTLKDTITIPRSEYETMKLAIINLERRVNKLEIENQQLRSVCDKYFKKYGELDLNEKENKNKINKER